MLTIDFRIEYLDFRIEYINSKIELQDFDLLNFMSVRSRSYTRACPAVRGDNPGG